MAVLNPLFIVVIIIGAFLLWCALNISFPFIGSVIYYIWEFKIFGTLFRILKIFGAGTYFENLKTFGAGNGDNDFLYYPVIWKLKNFWCKSCRDHNQF